MFSALSPGVIGVASSSLDQTIQMATEYGFGGIEVGAVEIAGLVDAHGAEAVKDKVSSAGLKLAGWGLPTKWRAESPEFEASLADLERLAAACGAIGATRVFTWIMPISDELEMDANLEYHRKRLGAVAKVLGDNGCSFGLEFIGPKTIRDKGKNLFIYQMLPMLALAKECGDNVGLLVDCWHWHTSGGTVAELESITAKDVVYVHVNDAPEGVDRDSLQDHVRSIPGATGVIDIAGFLAALRKIGYDGPITPEPFPSELAPMASDADRLRAVSDGMKKIMAV